jgi:hypothetical protein
MVELEHNPPRMLWEGMTVTHLIGPFPFDRPVNAASYLEILEACLYHSSETEGSW